MRFKTPLAFAVLGLICIGLGVYTRYYRRSAPTANRIPTPTPYTSTSFVDKLGDGKWKVIVDAQDLWFNTNIKVKAGDHLDIHATGQVKWNPKAQRELEALNLVGTVGPDGTRRPYPHLKEPFPMPDVGIGTLVMKIGGVKYAVGSDATIDVKENGTIELMVNDDYRLDNSGNFTATIQVK